VIGEGAALRLACAGLYLLIWLGFEFYVADPDRPSPSYALVSAAFVATSLGLGYGVGRWWAPLVVLAYLPTLAIPGTYGGGQPDYGVGVYFALLYLPAAAVLISLGVVARKVTGSE